MQGILPVKKNTASPKEQTALDRYIQQWQLADSVYNGMEHMVDELARQMEQALKPSKKKR